MTHIIQPVILCGGSGTRLWPLSTPDRPKQFLALTSSKSMIEETAERFSASKIDTLSFAKPLVVGSKRHTRLLAEKLPTARKILEPFGRNSAPAVAAACLAYAPDDMILILPADHDIRDIPSFHTAIETAADAAASGAIVTFGIHPTHAATGYGYIRAETGPEGTALAVEEFVEKPDQETAEAYLAAGSYYWNAGIFLFKASTMLDALKTHAPDLLTGVSAAMPRTAGDVAHLDPEAFAATPSISIDYAVMEHAPNVKTVPVSMGWSDVGGYRALHDLLTETETDNHTSGPVFVTNSEGLYVRSEGPAISINGVSNLVVVATPDEVMITPINEDGAVKTLGAAVQTGRHALGLSSDIKARAKAWLWEAFETWSNVGWDATRGGFVEQLNMDGTPDSDANRRVRVQARQVYSFSKAIEMGWPDVETAKTLIQNGIEYIDTRLRHAEGGFVHKITAEGEAIDDRRDLYDHAFMVLAGSAAYKATGSARALKIADDAIAYIDSALKDPVHGGWFESSEGELPRRANPHMHLLEAMMEYHAATGDETALDRAAEVVRLFETRFFNPANDVMAEFFTADWQLEGPADETIFEPGHHYEWATLLYMYEQLTGHDTGSWRRRLIRRADQTGINPKTGFAINALRANGEIIHDNSRLWHQLERGRAYLLHPEIMSSAQTESALNQIVDKYLIAGPSGGWLDEVCNQGRPTANAVPASMLYHALGTISVMIK